MTSGVRVLLWSMVAGCRGAGTPLPERFIDPGISAGDADIPDVKPGPIPVLDDPVVDVAAQLRSSGIPQIKEYDDDPRLVSADQNEQLTADKARDNQLRAQANAAGRSFMQAMQNLSSVLVTWKKDDQVQNNALRHFPNDGIAGEPGPPQRERYPEKPSKILEEKYEREHPWGAQPSAPPQPGSLTQGPARTRVESPHAPPRAPRRERDEDDEPREDAGARHHIREETVDDRGDRARRVRSRRDEDERDERDERRSSSREYRYEHERRREDRDEGDESEEDGEEGRRDGGRMRRFAERRHFVQDEDRGDDDDAPEPSHVKHGRGRARHEGVSFRDLRGARAAARPRQAPRAAAVRSSERFHRGRSHAHSRGSHWHRRGRSSSFMQIGEDTQYRSHPHRDDDRDYEDYDDRDDRDDRDAEPRRARRDDDDGHDDERPRSHRHHRREEEDDEDDDRYRHRGSDDRGRGYDDPAEESLRMDPSRLQGFAAASLHGAERDQAMNLQKCALGSCQTAVGQCARDGRCDQLLQCLASSGSNPHHAISRCENGSDDQAERDLLQCVRNRCAEQERFIDD